MYSAAFRTFHYVDRFVNKGTVTSLQAYPCKMASLRTEFRCTWVAQTTRRTAVSVWMYKQITLHARGASREQAPYRKQTRAAPPSLGSRPKSRSCTESLSSLKHGNNQCSALKSGCACRSRESVDVSFPYSKGSTPLCSKAVSNMLAAHDGCLSQLNNQQSH